MTIYVYTYICAYVHTYMHTYMHLGSWIFCVGSYLYSSIGSSSVLFLVSCPVYTGVLLLAQALLPVCKYRRVFFLVSSYVFLISSLLADLQLQTSLSCFQRAYSSLSASSLCDRRYTYSRSIDICGIVAEIGCCWNGAAQQKKEGWWYQATIAS